SSFGRRVRGLPCREQCLQPHRASLWQPWQAQKQASAARPLAEKQTLLSLGPDARRDRTQIREECHNAADFLRILMETIARKQGVERWAESTPLHLLYLPLIKKLFPDALIIHIIRDGRDVT